MTHHMPDREPDVLAALRHMAPGKAAAHGSDVATPDRVPRGRQSEPGAGGPLPRGDVAAERCSDRQR